MLFFFFFHTLCFTTDLNNIPTFRLNYRALLLDKKEYLARGREVGQVYREVMGAEYAVAMAAVVVPLAAVTAAAVVAVDNEDGIQCWRWRGGRSMAAAALGNNGN